MKKENEKTTAKTWLKMDLEMQSGSIWTDEKSGLQKEKNYPAQNYKPHILKPDPIKYGDKIILPNVGQIID